MLAVGDENPIFQRPKNSLSEAFGTVEWHGCRKGCKDAVAQITQCETCGKNHQRPVTPHRQRNQRSLYFVLSDPHLSEWMLLLTPQRMDNRYRKKEEGIQVPY
jgi:hypothetical protein